jgi:hypothetical protein
MRGSLKLFSDLLDKEVAVMTVTKQGRSSNLIDQRDECLVSRYHYYLNFTEKRYNKILDDLSKEFFISPFTIQERLTENYDHVLKLNSEKPAKQYFAKKWPHFVW